MNPKTSFAGRLFLLTLLGVIFPLAGSYFFIMDGVHADVKEDLHRSLVEANSSLISYTEENRQYSEKVRLLDDEVNYKALAELLRNPSVQNSFDPEKHRQAEVELQGISKLGNYKIFMLADVQNRPISMWLRSENNEVDFEPPPATFKLEKPYCTSCHTISTTNLAAVNGVIYKVDNLPIRTEGKIKGVLRVGEIMKGRSLKSFSYQAVLHDGKILLTSIPIDAVEEVENQLQNRCGGVIDGCEVKVFGKNYWALESGNAWLPENAMFVSFQTADVLTDNLTGSINRTFLATGFTTCAVIVILVGVSVRSSSKPLVRLASTLAGTGNPELISEKATDKSDVREITGILEAFNRASVAVQASNHNLKLTTLEFLEAMVGALEVRDSYTAGHSRRVSGYCIILGQALNLSVQELEVLGVAAKLHDIGKLAVPDAVLNKPGTLTAEEYKEIQAHPMVGKRLLERVGSFQAYLPAVECHHENYDGTGYPHGLKGNEIPLQARIMRVVDYFDALTTMRSYRGALSQEQVLHMIAEGSNTLFDPYIVQAFISLF